MKEAVVVVVGKGDDTAAAADVARVELDVFTVGRAEAGAAGEIDVGDDGRRLL